MSTFRKVRDALKALDEEFCTVERADAIYNTVVKWAKEFNRAQDQWAAYYTKLEKWRGSIDNEMCSFRSRVADCERMQTPAHKTEIDKRIRDNLTKLESIEKHLEHLRIADSKLEQKIDALIEAKKYEKSLYK